MWIPPTWQAFLAVNGNKALILIAEFYLPLWSCRDTARQGYCQEQFEQGTCNYRNSNAAACKKTCNICGLRQ
uniref:ShKT domain-containing protein n=1 Tax=Setaria digitata TaxID=48799 RepID=A0A915PF32_9BILA